MVNVRLRTSGGDLLLALDEDKAPKTVANFLEYVREGFFDGTIFHRVIEGFMMQGGGFEPGMRQKKTRPPITNEADNGLSNKAGSIAMARTSDPHSASAQFFINFNDNRELDFKSKTPPGWGYCVFGRVIEGMDVVNGFNGVPTGSRGQFRDVPVEDIVLEKAEIAEG